MNQKKLKFMSFHTSLLYDAYFSYLSFNERIGASREIIFFSDLHIDSPSCLSENSVLVVIQKKLKFVSFHISLLYDAYVSYFSSNERIGGSREIIFVSNLHIDSPSCLSENSVFSCESKKAEIHELSYLTSL